MRTLALLGFLAVVPSALAIEPCTSGLKPGQRPGPYSFAVSVGPQRGMLHCFICETADRPGIVVFARSLSDPLGKLVRGLDKALAEHKTAELRSWVTFLNDDQTAFDPPVVAWSKKQAVRNVSLGIFEDVVGPPAYRLNRDAEVTVLLFVKQKVVRNFAYRPAEWTNEAADEVLRAIPEILPKK